MGFSGSGISFTGLASGIDTESLIQRLMALEARPIQRLQLQQASLKNKLSAVDQYKSLLSSIKTIVAELSYSTAFNTMLATSSKPDVATVTASNTAMQGIYELAVTQLAQFHKVSTVAQQSLNESLNLSGSFLINGVAITVEESDSLSSIASKINSSKAGVTASVINGGEGNIFLTLTASTSGKNSAIIMSDINSDGVLSSLGFLSGSASIREEITNGARSMGFSDFTSTISSLLGADITSGSIKINDTEIYLDFSTDSLSTIAQKINTSAAGVTATVVEKNIDGKTKQYLEITGSTTPDFEDSNNMLQAIGILQKDYSNELLQAQDAQFSIDGINFTNSTNTVSNIIPGVTITLKDADASSPLKTKIAVQRDTSAVRSKIENLVKAYNSTLEFLSNASKFDSETFVSGPLFGDSNVIQIQSSMFMALTMSFEGIPGELKNLLAIGIDFDSSGKMTLDNAKFEKALSENHSNVVSLFTTQATISDPDIQFVSASSKTKASGLLGYAIEVTQLSTKGIISATEAFSGTSTETEILTFNGALFGNTDYQLSVASGSDIDSLISQINSDSKLKNLVQASKNDNGELVITSKKYGSPGNFTVKSNLEASNNNSGIGTEGITSNGLNVAGTINGEPAEGNGQYLTGLDTNQNTAGLQLLVTGGEIGYRGEIILTKGAATVLDNVLDGALDFINGSITAASKTLQDQIDDIDKRIKVIQENLTLRQNTLRRKFAAMEEMVARLQSQMTKIGGLLAALQATTNQNK